jgi:Kyakuja-Dileera-Zisupton transposase
MDFLFISSLSQWDILHLLEFIASYDVACQWSTHFWKRMLLYPSWFQFDYQSKLFRFLVPKFHLAAHIMKCQTEFSFNFTKGVGRTEGEAPERGWAGLNWAAASTVEMGPGFRRDVMDDHLGNINWQKTSNMGL